MSDSGNSLPRHIAIIMDGNGRWAKRRGLPRFAGHRAGVEAVREVVRACSALKVEVLTLFAFSSENWKRPRREVSLLMQLFTSALSREAERLHGAGVRLRVIGERSAFPGRLQRAIASAEAMTRDNTGLKLVIAANYGGRWDITQAARSLAQSVATGELHADDVTEANLGARLSIADLPEPDLFIRTGGEQRVSNFLLWQLAYTEFYFTELLWPEFGLTAFQQALSSFAQRQRRFGMTGEQVTGQPTELTEAAGGVRIGRA